MAHRHAGTPGQPVIPELELIDEQSWAAKNVAAVTPDTTSPDWYFPERTLAQWLAAHGLQQTVYAFPPLGVQLLRAAYQHLVQRLNIDAIVLVDGGTDILLRGDESELGTPVEDITSLAAQVIGRIEKFRNGIATRIPRAFPH